MVMMSVLSMKLPLQKRWPALAVTICVALGAGGCAVEPVRDAYKSGSDWLNDVPEAPEPGPWRLSKRVDGSNAPFPNLGDVPAWPAETVKLLEQDEKVLEAERTAAGTALRTSPENRAPAAALGAPPPANVQPLTIPPPPE
jgi:hypothetical protein